MCKVYRLSGYSGRKMNIGKHKGFTLVEIAIVLVIVGLLIGGVLKGREMLVNAKIKRVERDFEGIVTAMQAYNDRYLIMPGDDNRAASRFAIYATANPFDINGDASGFLDGDWQALANTETANFWKHLRAADLIPGDGNDATQPTNAYGGMVGVRDGSLTISGKVVIFGAIKGQTANILDAQLDDGKPATGLIQSDVSAALMDGNLASSVGVGTAYLDNTSYYIAFDI